MQKILKIHKCGLGDIFRESVTNIGNLEEEYLMTRNIGNRGICGLKSAEEQGDRSSWDVPRLLQRRSLLTFLHQFRSLGEGGEGGEGRVGSMGEGNVGDGQEARQSYTDGPIGLRTYFIFSKYLSEKVGKRCLNFEASCKCYIFWEIASTLVFLVFGQFWRTASRDGGLTLNNLPSQVHFYREAENKGWK